MTAPTWPFPPHDDDGFIILEPPRPEPQDMTDWEDALL